MDTRTDERLDALEIKASFQEDMLDELNKVVVRQQATIDLLVRELVALKAQQPEAGGPGLGADVVARALENAPPHY